MKVTIKLKSPTGGELTFECPVEQVKLIYDRVAMGEGILSIFDRSDRVVTIPVENIAYIVEGE